MHRICFTLLLGLCLEACGGKTSESTAVTYDAPVLSGLSIKGAVLSALSTDQTIADGGIYYYDFAKGQILELASGEKRDPGVFKVGTKFYIFSRDASPPTMRSIDVSQSPSTFSKTTTLTGIKQGDPHDVLALNDGTNLLLSSPTSNGLFVVNNSSGEVREEIKASWNLGTASKIRPRGLLRNDKKIYVIHHGLDVTSVGASADGSQTVFALSEETAGTVAAVDLATPSTSTIDGVTFSSSNAQAFLKSKGATDPIVFGLCSSSFGASCQSKPQRFRVASNSFDTIASTAPSGIEAYGKLVPGLTDNELFAHVKSGSTYSVSKLDLQNAKATEIYKFSDERIYGVFSHPDSGLLMLGAIENGNPMLIIYKNGEKVGQAMLPRVPHSADFY